MLRLQVLIAVVVVTLLAGCGGGIVPPIDGNNPTPTVKEWTFTTTGTSTVAVWSAYSGGTTPYGFSAVLKANGQIEIVSIGPTTGSTTGQVDADGNFATSTGTIRASGTVTHESAKLSVWWPSTPLVKTPYDVATTSSTGYSAYQGMWSGTYAMNDDVEHPMSFAVNEAGYITGTISEGSVTGTFYGRADDAGKTMAMTLPFQDAAHPGWKFTGAVDDAAQPYQASGSIASLDVTDHDSGAWNVTR